MRTLVFLGVLLAGTAHAACVPGAINLTTPMSFASHTYGVDGVHIAQGQVHHWCAPVGTVSATLLSFITADRTSSAQCSKVTLSVAGETSSATNNTIRIPAVAGQYEVDVTGGGTPTCDIAYMLYWQGGDPGVAPTPGPTPSPTVTPRNTPSPAVTGGCPTPTPCHCP